MLFFDAFTRIGPFPRKHPGQPWRLDDLVAEMRHCSISGALVAGAMTVRNDLMSENRRLSGQLAPHDFLFPVWNVMPHWTGEMPAPEELLRLLRETGVRAVSLYPKENEWDIDSRTAKPLLDELERGRILTLVDYGEFASPAQLERLLSEHPRLPVMLHGHWWGTQRVVIPLLRRHGNLNVTFDHFQIHYGLETLVEMGCADQLLYGSNAPQMAMGAHRAYIDYAFLDEATRKKIASGNLIRLLLGLKPPREIDNASEDELMAAARLGKPQPALVLDMHAHINDEGLDGAGGHVTMFRGGPKGVLAMFEKIGCAGAGLMSWSGTVGGNAPEGNACVRRALDNLPAGFWGLATFDPTHWSREEMQREMEAVYRDPRFLGMKPYLFGPAYDAPEYDFWWEMGEQRRLYALIHRTRDDFSEINKLAGKYPGVTWVAAHCGSDYKTAEGAIAAAKAHPNVMLEITLTPVPLGIIDFLAKGAGADRVLYGSDLPMRDPRPQLGWVVFSRLSVEDKRKILGGNAARILGGIRAWAAASKQDTGAKLE